MVKKLESVWMCCDRSKLSIFAKVMTSINLFWLEKVSVFELIPIFLGNSDFLAAASDNFRTIFVVVLLIAILIYLDRYFPPYRNNVSKDQPSVAVGLRYNFTHLRVLQRSSTFINRGPRQYQLCQKIRSLDVVGANLELTPKENCRKRNEVIAHCN